MQFHGQDVLSYQTENDIFVGSIVVVPLRNKPVMGVVTAVVGKPSFKTKPVTKILDAPPLPAKHVELLLWMRDYYPAPMGALTQLFLPKNLMQTSRNPAVSTPTSKTEPLPALTIDQRAALKQITESDSRSVILHGETGSGKTRVYIELAKQALDDGNSVIMLVPEISLTPQLAAAFERAFGPLVMILHSNMTSAKRRNIWLDLLQNKTPRIVIGPRSTLFVPLSQIGLIVMDESHDNAYKQDATPYYQTSRVAAKLAKLHMARFVMGSATPPVTDMYVANMRNIPVVRMLGQAVTNKTEVSYSLVDLKDRSLFTRQPHLSNVLLETIEHTLERGEQSLVFLNRRGTARLVLCQICAWQALCPHCDLPLTYHGDAHLMRCHTCGFKAPTVITCPICGSSEITFKSIGTKLIAHELQNAFPNARVQRFDTDNAKTERLENNYEAVKNGDIDILVGTQMLAKGLDLPKLATIGVVLADTTLYFPDYSASERTYQLLTQVLGRVGRGHRDAVAIDSLESLRVTCIISRTL